MARDARGARVEVEAPGAVYPNSPSYRFMGYVSVFEDAGFRKVGKAGKRSHVMRVDLT